MRLNLLRVVIQNPINNISWTVIKSTCFDYYDSQAQKQNACVIDLPTSKYTTSHLNHARGKFHSFENEIRST
jgi:hypothetical protein